jgi:hypothetical protein
MDPNEALAQIREITGTAMRGQAYDADRLVDLIAGLDQWLTDGGFLPANWQRTS